MSESVFYNEPIEDGLARILLQDKYKAGWHYMLNTDSVEGMTVFGKGPDGTRDEFKLNDSDESEVETYEMMHNNLHGDVIPTDATKFVRQQMAPKKNWTGIIVGITGAVICVAACALLIVLLYVRSKLNGV